MAGAEGVVTCVCQFRMLCWIYSMTIKLHEDDPPLQYDTPPLQILSFSRNSAASATTRPSLTLHITFLCRPLRTPRQRSQMRIFLLPISTAASANAARAGRNLIYCEQLNVSTTDSPSYLDKATTKAAALWAGWEKKESGVGYCRAVHL